MVRFASWLGVMIAVCGGLLGGVTRAQGDPGAICVITFDDANANGVPDAGEGPLAGVNVNLSTGGAIIATHITTGDAAPYCFEDLLRGEYTVIFTDAPTHRFTTPRQGTFALDFGQRLTIDPVGAVPVPLARMREDLLAQRAEDSTSEPLDSATRLLLATVGSVMVMLGMITLGGVVWMLLNRKPRVRPPQHIRPPDR